MPALARLAVSDALPVCASTRRPSKPMLALPASDGNPVVRRAAGPIRWVDFLANPCIELAVHSDDLVRSLDPMGDPGVEARRCHVRACRCRRGRWPTCSAGALPGAASRFGSRRLPPCSAWPGRATSGALRLRWSRRSDHLLPTRRRTRHLGRRCGVRRSAVLSGHRADLTAVLPPAPDRLGEMWTVGYAGRLR